ncbi:hypothetical protein QJ043_08120 [Olsenella sp. YH-ols2217]|uniref:MOSC domain-containing protein n=1 Tax=Kribbibacterium absianum TaxID=3044210 RepID=A0ABT6ZLW3_9ACTN|nr:MULTISPECIES: hypothetical protein [unclassified Olsenella]MDJ1122034.1 hypothetical protein [Olsenella sp. YH-ols2216]MDJ1130042.1 hypothetical protein [Olsenella sp. YH-ols2217]
MARVFVSDVRTVDFEGRPAVQALATVVSGEVRVGDRIEGQIARVVGLAQTCRTCSFGESLQEGDRGAITFACAGSHDVEPGTTIGIVPSE